ncbi:hypothetical protein HX870_03625 [Pseudomonas gingeri]|uniref:Uncharacterized protein n=1 Tax=Pseudomonas gingeri TaxID=117681 RepID=A0A7Y8C148_9PSED|nr:hypothetical protein [Pseudomonas gingeri]NWB95568.1 hypothetical protein [Pseudomonas gingeri]NWD66709.1 hypothetical protein [Pseudomonas gingeri]
MFEFAGDERGLMANSIRKISWFSALSLIWRGQAFGLGKNYRMISYWVKFAAMLSILAPFMEYSSSRDFIGAMPPDVPMVKTTGTFVRYVGHEGLKQVPYIIFRADNGVEYRTEHSVAPTAIDNLGGLKIPIKVYVEGFVLRDGRGSFYPLKITTVNGVYLESSDALMEELLIGRDPLHFKRLRGVFFMLLIPWGMSFFYASKLRVSGLKH